jgi:hypothetical protein
MVPMRFQEMTGQISGMKRARAQGTPEQFPSAVMYHVFNKGADIFVGVESRANFADVVPPRCLRKESQSGIDRPFWGVLDCVIGQSF